MSEAVPLQDRLKPENPIRKCYGCGTDNTLGLQLKSRMEGDEGIGRWHAQEHHCSYPGFLNGGIATTLIDCHSAWTAFASYCKELGLDMDKDSDLPTGWTKALNVEFLKAVSIDSEIVLRAKVVKQGTTSRTVTCSIFAGDDECVRATVVMVMKGA
jgi:acyl-coenzyme A thioesterase PaaI-like protein